MRPCASLANFPTMPQTAARRIPARAQARSASPVKIPISTKAIGGKCAKWRMANFSERLPVHRATSRWPLAAATCTACTTLARQDAVEYGLTIPQVPRMEMPPMIPRRPLSVFLAISSPPGTEMVTHSPWPASAGPAASVTSATIICRGTGLIAGPPTSNPSPGKVTVPTPSPPASAMPGLSCHSTRAWMNAPCVASGSSPASFTTAQLAQPSPVPQRTGVKVAASPIGSAIVMASGATPSTRATVAAFAAAAAHEPVVKPVRRPLRLRGGGSTSSSITRHPRPVRAAR